MSSVTEDRGPAPLAIPAANKAAFIRNERQAISAIMRAREVLLGLRRQYTALDLGNVLTDADMPDGLTMAQFRAAISSTDAIEALLIQGHDTNLYQVIL